MKTANYIQCRSWICIVYMLDFGVRRTFFTIYLIVFVRCAHTAATMATLCVRNITKVAHVFPTTQRNHLYLFNLVSVIQTHVVTVMWPNRYLNIVRQLKQFSVSIRLFCLRECVYKQQQLALFVSPKINRMVRFGTLTTPDDCILILPRLVYCGIHTHAHFDGDEFLILVSGIHATINIFALYAKANNFGVNWVVK